MRSGQVSAGVREGWRRRTLLLCTWLALLAQVVAPTLCAAGDHGTAMMPICTADGTVYVPLPGEGPAAPSHDPHDLCGLCCFHCARGGLALRVAILIAPPAIVAEIAWPHPEDSGSEAGRTEHRRPPGRAPPTILV
jgi:hypothetical protein